jgi:hypothetical protein
VIFIIVYIPPDANKANAENAITQAVTELESANPDAAIIIIGDFNGASLKSHLPLYKQFITCPTRGPSTLDLCYCNKKSAFKSTQRPPLGASDHNMILMQPTYVRKLKALKPIVKTIKERSEDLNEQVAGSLACIDWAVFWETCNSIHELTETISSYINFCVDSILPEKEVKIYPNNHPWVTK